VVDDEMAIKKKIAEKEELATVVKKSALSPEKEADFQKRNNCDRHW